MRTVKIYAVKPSRESKHEWMISGNQQLMERYAREMGGVVVEREIVSVSGTNQYDMR